MDVRPLFRLCIKPFYTKMDEPKASQESNGRTVTAEGICFPTEVLLHISTQSHCWETTLRMMLSCKILLSKICDAQLSFFGSLSELQRLPPLRKLTVLDVNVDLDEPEDSLATALNNCPNTLEILSLSSSSDPDSGLMQLYAINAALPEEVRFSNLKALRIICPEFERNYRGLCGLIRRCPKLTTLVIEDFIPQALPGQLPYIDAIVDSCPNLTNLRLHYETKHAKLLTDMFTFKKLEKLRNLKEFCVTAPSPFFLRLPHLDEIDWMKIWCQNMNAISPVGPRISFWYRDSVITALSLAVEYASPPAVESVIKTFCSEPNQELLPEYTSLYSTILSDQMPESPLMNKMYNLRALAHAGFDLGQVPSGFFLPRHAPLIEVVFKRFPCRDLFEIIFTEKLVPRGFAGAERVTIFEYAQMQNPGAIYFARESIFFLACSAPDLPTSIMDDERRGVDNFLKFLLEEADEICERVPQLSREQIGNWNSVDIFGRSVSSVCQNSSAQQLLKVHQAATEPGDDIGGQKSNLC